jgi:hypothetical protein
MLKAISDEAARQQGTTVNRYGAPGAAIRQGNTPIAINATA